MTSAKVIWACALVSVAILVAQAPASQPVVYYSGDQLGGTVSDESGNGNHGTVIGGVELSDDGYVGKSLAFNGTDAYVELQRPVQDDFAITAWIKTDATAPGGSYAYQGDGLFWADVEGADNDLVIGVLGTKLSLFGGNPDTSVNSNGDIVTGEWVHIAAVRNIGARTLSVYINGQLDNSVSYANTAPLDAQSIMVVGANTLDGRFYEGLMDEIRMYGRFLTDEQVAELYNGILPSWPKAETPDPADGAVGVTAPLLQWAPGEGAMFHDVYLGTSPELTEADRVATRQMFTMYYHMAGYESGATYYWRVDEIEADGVTVHTGNVWSFTTEPVTAYNPQPADDAEGAFLVPVLSWLPGKGTVQHHLYFGSDLTAVEQGATETDQGALEDLTFATPLLRASTTYYWRVDEILADGTVQAGPVWNFTTEDGVVGQIVREWWLNIGGGPVSMLTSDPRYPNNPSGSELLELFEGPTGWNDSYASRLRGWLVPPETGDYTFWIASDDDSQLWLSTDEDPANGALIASVSGWTGVREWTAQESQQSEPVTLQAGQKYYLQALHNEGAGGDHVAVAWQSPNGAQEVIPAAFVDTFAYPPLQAFSPAPADGAVETAQVLTLSWAAGEKGTQHDVYLGLDEEAVANADTSTADVYKGRQNGTTFTTGELVWDATYYWRVDEINAGDPESPWKGRIWSFTTADYILVDDFESYANDVGNRVFQTWVDGLGFSEPEPGNPGNGTGAIVGHDIWSVDSPYYNGELVETANVYGGSQALPLYYDNVSTPYVSGAERTWTTPQNWAGNGVTDLSLWFRGNPIGFMETAAGSFTISASGNDIWNQADQCRFVYKQLSGDGSILARVDSLGNTDQWAKATVMIRESLDGASRHASAAMSSLNGVQFLFRPTANGNSQSTTVGGISAPYWIKITRTGDTFKGQYSEDGVAWLDFLDADGNVLTETIPMIGNVYIGLAVTSHNVNAITVAEYSGVQTSGGVSGAWQVEEIGVDHPDNSLSDVYVTLEDSSGRAATVSYPDGAILSTWTPWVVSLTDFAGVNLAAVRKMTLGAGNPDAALPDGSGVVFFDDIRVTRPAEAFAEDFDSYTAGSDLHGQGGWKGWDNTPAAGAPASNAYALSGANAVEVIGSADLVHEFDFVGGTWEFTTMQYIPSGATGVTYFLLLNTYNDGGPCDWSVQIPFDLDAGTLTSDMGGGATAEIVYDQWVELKFVIDLDNDTVEEYYNGALLSTHEWDDNDHGTFQCIDLYGNGASSVYYDDITVK